MEKVAYFKFSFTIHENHYKAAIFVTGQMYASVALL